MGKITNAKVSGGLGHLPLHGQQLALTMRFNNIGFCVHNEQLQEIKNEVLEQYTG